MGKGMQRDFPVPASRWAQDEHARLLVHARHEGQVPARRSSQTASPEPMRHASLLQQAASNVVRIL
jgi:hypothetical protein